MPLMQALKDKAALTMLKVLTAFKSSEMENVIKSLSKEDIDLLVKYVYKCMEKPQDGSGAALLAWHEKLFSVAGHGAIIRAFTDRRRL